MPTCTVTIRNPRDVKYWVTTGGPKPKPDTVLEVHVVGSHAFYRVKANRIRKWQRDREGPGA